MIRVAQQGRTSFSIAESLDEVVAGVGVRWVEINGVRIAAEHGLASVDIHMDDGIGETTVTATVFGPVEIVYLGKDGAPLGPGPSVTDDAFFDHKTVTTS